MQGGWHCGEIHKVGVLAEPTLRLYEPFDEEDGAELNAGQIGVLYKKVTTSDDENPYEEDIFYLNSNNFSDSATAAKHSWMLLVEEGLTSANAMEARDPTTQQRGRPQSKRKQPVAGPMGPRPKGTRSDN